MSEPLHCPLCHEVGRHAERCPGREQEKAPEPKQSKLEATVDDWAQRIASDIPKPQSLGWTPKLPMQTPDGGRIVGPDGRPVGMKSEVVVQKTGAELLWQKKLAEEPCVTCAHFSRELFDEKDKVELFNFLTHEAGWQPEAVQLVLDNPLDYAVCRAHSLDGDNLHVTHKDASCLHLYQRKGKGWLQSFGSKIFGGSRRHDF